MKDRGNGVGTQVALERSEEFVQSAEGSVEREHWHVAVVCAYSAMYWAAVALLTWAGIKPGRWRHETLREALIIEMVLKRRILQQEVGHWMRETYELRRKALYTGGLLFANEVRRSVKQTREMVNRAKEVIRL